MTQLSWLHEKSSLQTDIFPDGLHQHPCALLLSFSSVLCMPSPWWRYIHKSGSETSLSIDEKYLSIVSPTPASESVGNQGVYAAPRPKALATISTFVLNPVLILDPTSKEWINSNARWASQICGAGDSSVVWRGFIITDIIHSTKTKPTSGHTFCRIHMVIGKQLSNHTELSHVLNTTCACHAKLFHQSFCSIFPNAKLCSSQRCAGFG